MTGDTYSASGPRGEMAKVGVFRAWTGKDGGFLTDTPFIPLSLAGACLLSFQVAFPEALGH